MGTSIRVLALRLAVSLVLALTPIAVGAAVYQGSLSAQGYVGGPGGLYGNDGWSAAVLSWSVSRLDGSADPWLYSYTLAGAPGTELKKLMSHMLLETSDGFGGSAGDITEVSAEVTYEIESFASGAPGNPGIPERFRDLYGVKFDWLEGRQTNTVTFQSVRDPVWGNWYAKNGVSSDPAYAYNLGVPGEQGAQPWAQPRTLTAGASWAYVLRPDTTTGPADGCATPEPHCGLLLVLGIVPLGIGLRVHRARRQSSSGGGRD